MKEKTKVYCTYHNKVGTIVEKKPFNYVYSLKVQFDEWICDYTQEGRLKSKSETSLLFVGALVKHKKQKFEHGWIKDIDMKSDFPLKIQTENGVLSYTLDGRWDFNTEPELDFL